MDALEAIFTRRSIRKYAAKPVSEADLKTILEAGMVLTLEPGVGTSGGIIVHEENIAITTTGARYLTPVAAREAVVL